jgi:hypothetical protein
MTDYADVPAVTALHGEAERVQQAISILAAGGTMSIFTVTPPPPEPGVMLPVVMAVSISVVDPISAEMVTALNNWLTTRLATITDELATYDVTAPPPPLTDPPGNIDPPVVAQDASNLTSTDGTWSNTPTSFTYQWARDDGGTITSSSPSYPILFADIGVTFTCTVSASNQIGTTIGPPSNSVTVVSPP